MAIKGEPPANDVRIAGVLTLPRAFAQDRDGATSAHVLGVIECPAYQRLHPQDSKVAGGDALTGELLAMPVHFEREERGLPHRERFEAPRHAEIQEIRVGKGVAVLVRRCS